MTTLAGKRILIFQQRGWGLTIGHFLAKKLQNEGVKLAALTIKRATHQFVVDHDEISYELICDADAIKEDPRVFLGEDRISLEQICAELDIGSVWEIVQSARNHVRSYADKYYYGFKQNLSDEEIVSYVKAIYKNVRHLFDAFEPDLIVTPNFAGLQHIIFNLYANKHGVEMLGVTDTKIYGVSRFNLRYLSDRGYLFDRLAEINGGAPSNNRERAIRYIEESRTKLRTPKHWELADNSPRTHWRHWLRAEIRPYLRIWSEMKNKRRNRLKNLVVSIDDISPWYVLRDHYGAKRNRRSAQTYDYAPLPKARGYVYMPLQVQPEAVIDVCAARFNNQIETARQVAMVLPGDLTLVVKDHPSMVERRPSSYLEKIARTPNVRLIDYRVSTQQVLEGAALVVSLGGTTIAEAAMMSRPAIQLGNLGTTRFFPNVTVHNELSTLGACIRETLKLDLTTDEYRQSLINYVSAVLDVGFDFDYYGTWSGRASTNLEEFWPIFRTEVARLLLAESPVTGAGVVSASS